MSSLLSAPAFRSWIACWGAAGLSACSVGPDFTLPETRLPGSYIAKLDATTSTAKPAASVDLAQWWRSFRDPQLVSLVERSIAANPDIAIALARLQQARAQQFVAIGAALPKAGLSAGAAVGTGTDNTPGRVAGEVHSAANTTGYNHLDEAGGLDTAWELDIFGKLRREIEASHLDALAAAKARDAVLVSVIANVARAYIEMRGFQAQIAVTHRNIESARRRFQVVQTRFSQGLTNELDVTLAQRQLPTFDTGFGSLTGQLQSSQYVIAALLGQYPETFAHQLRTDGPAPRFPARVPTGLPVSLLQRRADIQQAEFEIGAATARMGPAIADLFPRVALPSALGGQAGPRAATGTPITFIGGGGSGFFLAGLGFRAVGGRLVVAGCFAPREEVRVKANVVG